jgi:hypothetical protein
MVLAINPGFSLWSKVTKNRRKAPAYHGMAAKKNPNKKLQQKTEVQFVWWEIVFFLDTCKIHEKCSAQADLRHWYDGLAQYK